MEREGLYGSAHELKTKPRPLCPLPSRCPVPSHAPRSLFFPRLYPTVTQYKTGKASLFAQGEFGEEAAHHAHAEREREHASDPPCSTSSSLLIPPVLFFLFLSLLSR